MAGRRIFKWESIKVGDLVECKCDGVTKTFLVYEKVEADKERTDNQPPLRLAVLYNGDERYALFEEDLGKDGGVTKIWEGAVMKKLLEKLEV